MTTREGTMRTSEEIKAEIRRVRADYRHIEDLIELNPNNHDLLVIYRYALAGCNTVERALLAELNAARERETLAALRTGGAVSVHPDPRDENGGGQ